MSNGELVSRTPSADRMTWVWEQDEPMASELSLISIGRYTIYESDVTLASGRVLPEWSFIDPTVAGPSLDASLNSRSQLKAYIDFFETRYGPYPGNSTGIVVDVVPIGINYALETQDRPFFPVSAGATTTIHEVMHQWFGNNVSPRVWNDLWLGEGPATFAEVQYPNEGAGTSSETTEGEFYGLWNSTAANHSRWTIPPAGMTDSADLYGWHVYDRGAMTLEALKAAIGASDFAALMEEWQDRYAGASPGTTAFIDLAEEIDGRDLTAFFQDWIYDPDKPAWPARFDLALASSPASGGVPPGATVTYTVSATNTGRVPLSNAIVTVDLTDVLDNATIDGGSLPAGLTLNGTVLTWSVPATAVASTSTASFPAVVDSVPNPGTLAATARATTLGSTCTSCQSTLEVLDEISPAPAPTVTGTPKVGATLTAATGTWAAGTTFAYQWLRGGSEIPGATSGSYTVPPSDLGEVLRVRVTGARSGNLPTTRTSEPTQAVAMGRLSQPPTPKITGKAKVGKRLKVIPGRWDPGVMLRYRWYVGGKAVPRGTDVRFKVPKRHIGLRIHVRVTGTKPGYVSSAAISKRTPKVT